MTRRGWSRPYGKVTDVSGCRVDLATVLGSGGLPAAPARLELRWRHPGAANARRRTYPGPAGTLPDGLAALDSLWAAWRDPVRYRPDGSGLPVAVPAPSVPQTAPAPLAAWIPPEPVDLPQPPPALAGPVLTGTVLARAADEQDREWLAYEPTALTLLGAENLLLRQVAGGRLALGPTVEDLIVETLRVRWKHWGPAHRQNMRQILGTLSAWAVYREPDEDASPAYREYCLARLALDGVEEDASLHARLLMPDDFLRLISLRHHSDLRTELLNRQAVSRWSAHRDRYDAFLERKARGDWHGRPVPEPGDLRLRRTQPCSPRTEQLFATAISEVITTGRAIGVFLGTDPWTRLMASPMPAYRRPRPLLPSGRNTLSGQRWLDLADAIASIGPTNPRTGLPEGDRFRALMLAAAGMPRPSELSYLAPDDYLPGIRALGIRGAQYRVLREVLDEYDPLDPDAVVGMAIRHRTKSGEPGEQRVAHLPAVAAEAIERHLDLNYASTDRLFTGVGTAGWLDWNAITDRYWRPAVTRVLGNHPELVLREMQPRWLRKSAVTFQLAAGRAPHEVAEAAGHDVAVMLTHYAGVIAGSDGRRHTWSGIDDAWDWFVQHGHDTSGRDPRD